MQAPLAGIPLLFFFSPGLQKRNQANKEKILFTSPLKEPPPPLRPPIPPIQLFFVLVFFRDVRGDWCRIERNFTYQQKVGVFFFYFWSSQGSLLDIPVLFSFCLQYDNYCTTTTIYDVSAHINNIFIFI